LSIFVQSRTDCHLIKPSDVAPNVAPNCASTARCTVYGQLKNFNGISPVMTHPRMVG
jgi:hypothetical protein